jgi:hypothetical protein
MKTTLLAAGAAAVCMGLWATTAAAGPIETACLRSDRQAANRSVCNCIQQVADQTLAGSDQRRAAKFFSDPDRAHSTWMSKSSGDDAFWERYKIFGSQAETYCAGV